MFRTLSIFLFLLASATPFASAQSYSTASRPADLQVGGGFTLANSDYTANYIRGLAFYGDIDFKEHWGVEGDFHQLNDPQPTDIYERTYEIGGRYVRHYGRLHPYAKAMYGRGVFNFYQNEGNLAYNMFVVGAGVDLRITPRINARFDYEYQNWLSGPGLSNGLTPQLFTFGVAYHLPAGRHALY